MSGVRYPEEFKIEAVKQVTDWGYKIGEVAKRLGVTPKSMHDWIKKYGDTGSQHQTITANKMSCDSSRLSFEASRRSGIY